MQFEKRSVWNKVVYFYVVLLLTVFSWNKLQMRWHLLWCRWADFKFCKILWNIKCFYSKMSWHIPILKISLWTFSLTIPTICDKNILSSHFLHCFGWKVGHLNCFFDSNQVKWYVSWHLWKLKACFVPGEHIYLLSSLSKLCYYCLPADKNTVNLKVKCKVTLQETGISGLIFTGIGMLWKPWQRQHRLIW